jgi:hypothetical protein
MGNTPSYYWSRVEIDGEEPFKFGLEVNDKIRDVADLRTATQQQLAQRALSHCTPDQLSVFIIENGYERRLESNESLNVFKNKSSPEKSGIIIRAPAKQGFCYCLFILSCMLCNFYFKHVVYLFIYLIVLIFNFHMDERMVFFY